MDTKGVRKTECICIYLCNVDDIHVFISIRCFRIFKLIPVHLLIHLKTNSSDYLQRKIRVFQSVQKTSVGRGRGRGRGRDNSVIKMIIDCRRHPTTPCGVPLPVNRYTSAPNIPYSFQYGMFVFQE